ncbi:MAG: hypothetical protein GY938_03970 [Ketobacter sp.]|nr:hypothetical protein [Ketobacter sp.]
MNNALEARRALTDQEVRGVLHNMPLDSPVLCAALNNFFVSKRVSLGPYQMRRHYTVKALDSFIKGLERVDFGTGHIGARNEFANAVLHILTFFSETIQSSGISYRLRFIPWNQQKSHPHYDNSALTLVRAFLGPGTIIHCGQKVQFTVDSNSLLILKGTAFPYIGERQALLHDYPTSETPGSSKAGRIVMVARARRWRPIDEPII